MMADFPELKNDTFLRILEGKRTDHTAVWLMRQAGRYLPEFRELRKDHDFFNICRTPELASEITLQPLRRFPLDAAIIFSDILVVPQAMGLQVDMVAGVGPVFPDPLTTPSSVKRLTQVNVAQDLKYVSDAITLTRHKLQGDVPLLGFSGAPWTLMGYMIEGGSSKTLSKAKRWLYQWPNESLDLLGKISDVVIDYCVEQTKAGAQALQIFDTNAEYLAASQFQNFSLPFIRKIRDGVRTKLHQEGAPQVPMIIFAKGAHHSLGELADCGYDAISLDWTVSPQTARAAAGNDVVLQGNLDPCALYAPLPDIEVIVRDMLDRFGPRRHIANLGHGIYPDVNPECVGKFVSSVHSISKEMND